MLIVQRKVGQSIQIGDNVEIVFIKTGENSIKLGVNAPKNVRVKRGEENEKREEGE